MHKQAFLYGESSSLHLIATPPKEANDFRLLNKGDELQEELAQLQIMIKKQQTRVCSEMTKCTRTVNLLRGDENEKSTKKIRNK